jgi:hypothetical protein
MFALGLFDHGSKYCFVRHGRYPIGYHYDQWYERRASESNPAGLAAFALDSPVSIAAGGPMLTTGRRSENGAASNRMERRRFTRCTEICGDLLS